MLNRCQVDPWRGEGEADSRVGSGGAVPNKPLTTLGAQDCEPFSALQHSKTPETPNLSKICPGDCFWGVPVWGTKIWKKLSNFVRKLPFFQVLTIFFQIFVPQTGTPKNNRWDKFGVSGVFECCKGRKGFATQRLKRSDSPNFGPENGKHPSDHNHQDFLKSTARQMGGISQYKWEAYCDTNGRSTDNISLSLEPRGTKSTAIQIGRVLQYKWEVYCDTFLRGSGGWGFWHSSVKRTMAQWGPNSRICVMLSYFSPGVRSKAPSYSSCFLWVDCKIVIFSIFIKP